MTRDAWIDGMGWEGLGESGRKSEKTEAANTAEQHGQERHNPRHTQGTFRMEDPSLSSTQAPPVLTETQSMHSYGPERGSGQALDI